MPAWPQLSSLTFINFSFSFSIHCQTAAESLPNKQISAAHSACARRRSPGPVKWRPIVHQFTISLRTRRPPQCGGFSFSIAGLTVFEERRLPSISLFDQTHPPAPNAPFGITQVNLNSISSSKTVLLPSRRMQIEQIDSSIEPYGPRYACLGLRSRFFARN